MRRSDVVVIISFTTSFIDEDFRRLLLISGLEYEEGLKLDVHVYSSKEYNKLKDICWNTKRQPNLTHMDIDIYDMFNKK